MKRSEISLKNMLDIVATCIILYIINNEGIEEDQIIEAENILAKRVIKGELREERELQEKKVWLAEMKKKVLARNDALILNDINDVESNLFLLRENEKANDLLSEATIMHNLLAKSL